MNRLDLKEGVPLSPQPGNGTGKNLTGRNFAHILVFLAHSQEDVNVRIETLWANDQSNIFTTIHDSALTLSMGFFC